MNTTARLARAFSFPLLAKELTEAAARRRTYVTRVLYAVLLYALFALMMPRWLWRADLAPLQAMGAGRQLFETLCVLQFFGIALFLPALMCGRIAQEKERDSLVLLLLTALKPWRIVLEKYLGGLVPMLTFLLLGMPLAAIAYAFGGVTPEKLYGYLYALVVTCLQIGAIALFCSAWCRTTVGAFLATYFVGAMFYAGPPLAVELIDEVRQFTADRTFSSSTREWAFTLVPLYGAEESLRYFENIRAAGWTGPLWNVNYPPLYKALMKLAPPLLSIPFFLLLARVALVRRAFAPPSNLLLTVFRFFDTIMKRANRLVGNVMLVREQENLPGDAPIYWRETARRALGKVHYLVRIFVMVEIPVLFVCVLAAGIDYGGQAEGLSVLAAFLGALAAIALSVQAANTIVSERVQQTLEVLLTTPLSGRQIVLEKARALRRPALVAAVPLLTVIVTECWLEAGLNTADGWLAYLVCAVSLVAIYLPMITWLSLWIGLRVRTRFRAIITALIALVLWCALPVVLMLALLSAGGNFPSEQPFWARTIGLLSPLTVGALNEASDLADFPWGIASPWPAIATNALLYGTLNLLLRQHTLAHADRLLRR